MCGSWDELEVKLGSDAAPDLVIAPGTGAAQMGARLEMPSGGGRVITLGSYVRALAGFGPLDYRLCLWGWGGSVGSANKLLGRTNVHTVGGAASAPGNLTKVMWDLEEPAEIPEFWELMVGVAWETNPAHVAMLGGYSGTGDRYRKDLAAGAAWPTSMEDSVHLTDHNFAAWIEEYVPLKGIWVMRDGEWLEATAWTNPVLVRRSGFWESAEVKVRRGGAWVDVGAIVG